MVTYRRPELTQQEFLAPDGTPITYGQRWPMQSPPEDTYSVTTHPQRFAPLHTAADALLDYLTESFDVTVTEDVRPENRPDHDAGRGPTYTRDLRLRPASTDATDLYLGWTDFPGIELHTGVLGCVARFPACGCDACDEDLKRLVEDLEMWVFAVVEGRFREQLRGRWANASITSADGSASRGTGSHMPMDRQQQRRAKQRLASLPAQQWQPWPQRG